MNQCCDANGQCQFGHGCPSDAAKVAKHKPLAGGNVLPSALLVEPMTALDRVIVAVLLGWCFGVLYGAFRYYASLFN